MSLVGFPLSEAEIARVIENWALAISPLVFAVGSQDGAFCAASGNAVKTPRVRTAAILFAVAVIKDLPDLSMKRGWIGVR